ncbi:MAG TPA: DUF4260 domain-containing protein [Acidobacteriaceae bacterium]|nr:DUF4260 domain-containing protein [Acidobacteriaceae bacterium]
MLTRPAVLLRIEEALLLVLLLLLYHDLHLSWILFAILFLAPDLSMLGYLISPRVGSALYNLGHIFVLPVILLLVAFAMHRHALLAPGLIWLAHILLDRVLGYGLKYATAFKDTHLQRI